MRLPTMVGSSMIFLSGALSKQFDEVVLTVKGTAGLEFVEKRNIYPEVKLTFRGGSRTLMICGDFVE
jgi:hypothetical protein